MKLISRKALVAVAATTALTFSGLTAPAFADEDPAGSSFGGSSDGALLQSKTGDDDEAKEDGPASPEVTTTTTTTTPEKPSGSSSEDAKPGEIKDWIGVFTAIIGALSAAFVFAQKFMNN